MHGRRRRLRARATPGTGAICARGVKIGSEQRRRVVQRTLSMSRSNSQTITMRSQLTTIAVLFALFQLADAVMAQAATTVRGLRRGSPMRAGWRSVPPPSPLPLPLPARVPDAPSLAGRWAPEPGARLKLSRTIDFLTDAPATLAVHRIIGITTPSPTAVPTFGPLCKPKGTDWRTRYPPLSRHRISANEMMAKSRVAGHHFGGGERCAERTSLGLERPVGQIARRLFGCSLTKF